VLHSDLKVRNVLLKSDASARGCIAKVADFGLAVRMDCMDTHVSAFQVGVVGQPKTIFVPCNGLSMGLN
jgi:serine/threonine protein kinase